MLSVGLGVVVLMGCSVAWAQEASEGIAAGFPGDVGIEKHPAVLFASGFEDGFEGWSLVERDRRAQRDLEDVQPAREAGAREGHGIGGVIEDDDGNDGAGGLEGRCRIHRERLQRRYLGRHCRPCAPGRPCFPAGGADWARRPGRVRLTWVNCAGRAGC